MRYVASFVVGLFLLGSALPADESEPGALVEASVKEPPKVVAARVGDLLQLTYGFGVVPGQMPSTLKVDTGGAGLSKVSVVSVQNLAPNGRPLVGAGKMAAFLKADKAGTFTVRVTPDIPNPQTYEVKVKVDAR